mmetsp:Transcript_29270/g.93818  ORF Transcript_29270/g.93818 Transcript_29270/m.93818 type:complete len:1764 (-) Transcript_29270:152-5443(-)|eukprot:CAMPEP_0118882590 /NCGR_PEP_ID=MMETSP1163-20130328/21820_1 /TAXON_ID=124430 /ORGANISM="Phaeomonas parva, Strain CCMP2877" /LENGTH=1763 /DNA_ID=CAMNT_0006819709 /DNA_START=22 /DNA_END=5313 /DNA_ORIENTATION=-
MQLTHLKTVVEPAGGPAKVTAIAWSPNNLRLAVCTVDRVVTLFNEAGEKMDKFATKPAEKGPKNYIVRAMQFSPDSTKLAIAQSDNIVFVYKLGSEWNDKKSICNKFGTKASVTCLTWPSNRQGEVVFGLADGKVLKGTLRSNKSAEVYDQHAFTTAISSSPDGKGIVSAHLDGTIYRMFYDDSVGGRVMGKIAHHPCVPYALAWGQAICCAGNDGQVVFYDADGGLERTFDYRADERCREFTCAAFNPTGESVVVGNYNRFYTFTMNSKTDTWEETGVKDVENMYTVTALGWKKDGSRLTVGALCGVLDLYDACVRRYRYKGRFEFTYVSLSQVIVKRLSTGARIVLSSTYGCEITRINIFHDRFVVANTSETLLLGDLETFKLSEVQWYGGGAVGSSGPNEKFVFDTPTCCVVYRAGELSIVEYGQNEILGSVRTDHISGHLLSVRINERPPRPPADGPAGPRGGSGEGQENKKIAYLLDLQTLCVKDLVTQASTTISHDSKIDWLELNGRGNLLLFRDKRRQLHLYDIDLQSRSTLLNYCTYVQWVPESDVVVAQSRGSLNVWYNIYAPDQVTVHQIRGDVEEIERGGGRTEVIVDEGISQASYLLDEPLIDFGTAVDDRDYARAMDILEALEVTPEAEAMWKQLMQMALEGGDLLIAERCAAALGDVASSRYLHEVNKLVDEAGEKSGMDGRDHWAVRSKMALLRKDLRGAEDILLAQGRTDETIEMYQTLHQFEAAIRVAEARRHPDAGAMRSQIFQFLLDSGQEARAAGLKEAEGDVTQAIDLYLRAGMPAKAAAAIHKHRISSPSSLLENVASELANASLHDKAGEFYEQMGQLQRAMDSYVRGDAYRKAVELARRSFPAQVVALQEQWGDHLVAQKQIDMAINHYIEANVHTKAIEAALNSRQWSKALTLVDSIDPEVAKPYFRRLARHYEDCAQYEEAEKCYVSAQAPQLAVEMYTAANLWERAHKLALSCMSEAEVGMLYINRAQREEGAGRLREAEKLYLTVGEADLAINMYKKARRYDAMVRLVAELRPHLLKETHTFLAQEFEVEGSLREAETHYVAAEDWSSAVNMYRTAGLWEEALRLAKYHGGVNAAKRVAYAWALSLGAKDGAKLLNKLNLMEACIGVAIENSAFDQAFQWAEAGCLKMKPEIHLKHALFLEDDDNFKAAEEEFVAAGKPREAIDMYVHNQDWAAAMRVAETHDPRAVGAVQAAEGQVEQERGNHARAEKLYIDAGKPEMALEMYRAANLWEDAVRVMQRHLPHQMADVTREWKKAEAQAGTGGSKADYLSAGRLWEQSAEWEQAVAAYLNARREVLTDPQDLEEVLLCAVEVARAHLPNRYLGVVRDVVGRLKQVKRHETAADLLVDASQVEEAVEVCAEGGAFDKARRIAQSSGDAALLQRVQKEYQQHLVQEEDIGGLRGLGNAEAALDVLAQRGDWDGIWETSEQERVSDAVRSRYAAKRAAELLEGGMSGRCSIQDAVEAAQTLCKQGAPTSEQHHDMYKELTRRILGATKVEEEECKQYVEGVEALRDVLYNVSAGVKNLRSNLGEDIEELLMAAHYAELLHTCQEHDLLDLALKASITLLRYSGVINSDKLFYTAGMLARDAGHPNLAFVLLNRYVDLAEAIEERDPSLVDNADFADATAVPFDDTLPPPSQQYLTGEDMRAEVRDWVLSVCGDPDISQSLPLADDAVGTVYEGLFASDHPTCIVTGYPVSPAELITVNNARARKADWNAYVARTHKCPWTKAEASPRY